MSHNISPSLSDLLHSVWQALLLLLSRFSRVWLCDPIDSSPPGSPKPWSLVAILGLVLGWRSASPRVASVVFLWGVPGINTQPPLRKRLQADVKTYPGCTVLVASEVVSLAFSVKSCRVPAQEKHPHPSWTGPDPWNLGQWEPLCWMEGSGTQGVVLGDLTPASHFEPDISSIPIFFLINFYWSIVVFGLPWLLSGIESTCQFRRHGFDPWVGNIPCRRKWQSIPVFLPGKSHGQRSLMGYSPWDCKRVGRDLATKRPP